MKNSAYYAGFCSAILAVLASTAAAEETSTRGSSVLEEIVVTATKTGETALQDTAIAISAFNADTLEQSGIDDVEDVAALTPNFSFSSNGPWAISTIRGIGTNSVFVGGDPSTTAQVDGVYYARVSSGNLDFVDVDRVEVLRGPQGTLYGRNATAGTINVITRDPGDEASVTLKASAGTDSFYRIDGALSGPLVDGRVYGGLTARVSERDGYLDQQAAGVDDFWDEDRTYVRGKLRFTPISTLDILFSADVSNTDESYNFDTTRIASPIPDGFTPGFFDVATNNRNFYESDTWGVSGRVIWDLGDNYTLTSITAYRESELFLVGDLDATANLAAHTRAFPENQEQITQEINLGGTFDNWKFITGLFYFDESADTFFNSENGLFGALQTNGIDAPTESIAVFAQANWSLSDRLELVVGGRYTEDDKEATNFFGLESIPGYVPLSNVPFPGSDPLTMAAPLLRFPTVSDTFSAFTPKLGLNYRPNDDLLLYGTVTRGFKSGGFNLLIDFGGPVGYNEETVWAYEAGLKSTLLDGRAQLNATAFYYDYEDLQVNQFSSDSVVFGQVILNAPGAKVSGLELESLFRVSETFLIGGNLALLDSEYDGSFQVSDDIAAVFVDANGNRLSNAPELSGNVFAEWAISFDGRRDLVFHVDGIYRDEVFYTPSNNAVERDGSAFLVNASVAFTSDRWELGLVGHNLTDEEYLTRASTLIVFTNGRPGAPRNAHAYVKYSF